MGASEGMPPIRFPLRISLTGVCLRRHRLLSISSAFGQIGSKRLDASDFPLTLPSCRFTFLR